MMNKKRLTGLVAGGLCALSLTIAPIASAATVGSAGSAPPAATPNCANVGSSTTLCQTNGSASLTTKPEIRNFGWYQQYPYWALPSRHYHGR